MFSFILLIASIGLFTTSLILIFIDLISKKRHQMELSDKKFPKLSKYSVILALITLILLGFVHITVIL